MATFWPKELPDFICVLHHVNRLLCIAHNNWTRLDVDSLWFPSSAAVTQFRLWMQNLREKVCYENRFWKVQVSGTSRQKYKWNCTDKILTYLLISHRQQRCHDGKNLSTVKSSLDMTEVTFFCNILNDYMHMLGNQMLTNLLLGVSI